MSKLEIAKKLAAITGKPLSDFFDGEINEEAHNEILPEEDDNKEEPAGSSEAVGSAERQSTNAEIKKVSPPSTEVIEYQKMFAGSKIVNNKIMNGREMTRKEYLKFTKNLTHDILCEHPLLYKMFRAEQQIEAFFTRWCNKFPEAK